jgi:hypothetical protein
MFPSSSKGKEKPTLLDALERDNLNYWDQQSRCLPLLIWERKQIQFPKRRVFT